MEKLKLNETPIRTSRNFNVNNIKLEGVKIPEKQEFKNVKIINKNSQLDENVLNKKLIYGNGKILEENIENDANHKLKIVGNKKKETIEINYNFDDENVNLINNIEIHAKSEMNVFIKYKSNTEKACFHNGIIRVFGETNSKVNIVIINLLNLYSNNFESIENELEENANLKYTIIDIGGKNSVVNYYSNVIGKKAKNELETVYLGIKNQIKDMNYIAHLKGEKSEINIDAQGALNDVAKKNFKGTIDFKKGCKRAVGSENEYCMLLSDKAKSIALPILLCTEDDVEGSHSSASGKAEEDKLFYIMSRGISYKEAIKLMVKARFYKIIKNIHNEQLQEEILEEVDRRLD